MDRLRRFVKVVALLAPLTLATPASAATGSIGGTITGPHGPENNAWVILEKDGAYLISTWTPPDGTYGFVNLAAGSYSVSVVPTDALRVDRLPLTLADGEHRTFDVAVTLGGSIIGTVRNEAGEPVQGAQVLAAIVGEFGNHGALSGADGTYSISGMVAGTYRVSVLPPVGTGYAGQDRGFVDVTADHATDGVDITLTIGPAVVQTGKQEAPSSSQPAATQTTSRSPYRDPYADPYRDPYQDPYRDPAPQPRAHVTLQGRRLHVSPADGAIATLACWKRTECPGFAVLRSPHGGSLASTTFRIAAGHVRRIGIPLSRTAQHMLAHHHGRFRARLTVTGPSMYGGAWTVTVARH